MLLLDKGADVNAVNKVSDCAMEGCVRVCVCVVAYQTMFVVCRLCFICVVCVCVCCACVCLCVMCVLCESTYRPKQINIAAEGLKENIRLFVTLRAASSIWVA